MDPSGSATPSGEVGPIRLGGNHRRHVLSTFRYVDELLAKAEQTLVAGDTGSPFPEYVADATDLQVRVSRDYIRTVRETLRRALERLDIEVPPAQIGATWAARSALMFAQIAIDELRPKRMRGYGELLEGASREMDGIAAELYRLLEKVSAYLAQGPGKDLEARLERLERSTDEARVLREIERIVRDHGLVEFRAPLSLIVERFESRQLEVAVFGRVNSGKSSLLNYVLGTDALPVGVTPITAVPTRIRHGDRPLARILFADGRDALEVGLGELPDYASEERNPGNHRRVAAILVEIPNPRLANGVVLADTPGLGSLATAGSAATLAYLPRCDLGVLLVDAAGTLTQDDLGIIGALGEVGARVMVLVSKMDRLLPVEQARALDYVRQNVATRTGMNVPVFGVSVVGPAAGLADAWFESHMLPLVKEQESLVTASLRRKIGVLAEAVSTALESRLRFRSAGSSADLLIRRDQAEDRLRGAEARLESAAKRCEVCAVDLDGCAEAVFGEAAQTLAQEWFLEDSAPALPAPILATSFRNQASTIAIAVSDALSETASELSVALRAAAAVVPSPVDDVDDLSGPRGMPIPDLGVSPPQLRVQRPLLSFLGVDYCRAHALRRIRRQAGKAVQESLWRFRRALIEWTGAYLARLRKEFDAKADLYRGRLRLPESTGTADQPGSEGDIRKDLEILAALLGRESDRAECPIADTVSGAARETQAKSCGASP